MSSFMDQARARALRPIQALPRPRLTVVSRAATRAPRVPFVVLVVSVLVAGLIGLLLLNTALQRGAYVTADLRAQSQELALRQQNLELRVSALSEPQHLSQRALALGMVANDSPAFLRLSDSRIIGTPTAGKRSNQVDVSHLATANQGGAQKLSEPLAGSLNSLGSGAVEVAAPHKPGDHGRNDPTRGSDR